MRYRYYLCDVFTATRFGGNQLAVLPQAEGLSSGQMQQVAREFNFSETTFVFPPEEAGHTNKVRIFTPGAEVPFAGHPNIGTAFVLATTGRLGAIDTTLTVTFEERAGLVPITIRTRPDQSVWCELAAPERLSLGKTVDIQTLAAVLSLTADDIATETHLPQVASVGLPFLFVEIRDRATLERVRVNSEKLETLATDSIPSLVHVYTRSEDTDCDIRARMFAPLLGVPEDPATAVPTAPWPACSATTRSARTAYSTGALCKGWSWDAPVCLRRGRRNARALSPTPGSVGPASWSATAGLRLAPSLPQAFRPNADRVYSYPWGKRPVSARTRRMMESSG